MQLRERGTYAFGPFRLDPTRRTLTDAHGEVTLTARLFDTLLYLVQNSERLVERDELAHAVWADRAVAEGNLQKAISSLRKALHEHAPDEIFIRTVSGRGFRFAVPVIFEPDTMELSIADPFAPPVPIPKRPLQWWRSRSAILFALLLLCVAALIAITVVFRRSGSETAPPARFAPPAHSVAVMAFTNLSGDPHQEYFADGISEELINALGRIGKLKVAARLSSFSFKSKPVTVANIGRQLDVGTVLEGSVRRDGARLRVTAQLIDARTGYQLWSRDFDRNEGDILNVQDDIAEAVATSLKVTLLSDDLARLTTGNTTNPKAWDAYLRGMALGNQLTSASLRHGMDAFDAALAYDPNFALAHVERAATMIDFAEGFGGLGSDVTATQRYRAQALAEAERAVALAPRLGAAHGVLAGADEELWRFPAAEAEYARARALAPGDAAIELRFARFETSMGRRSSAVAAAQDAAQLDPLSAGAYLDLVSVLTWARRPDDALTALHHAEQLGFVGLRDINQRAQVALQKRDYAEVRQTCSGMRDWIQDYYLAIADHALGYQGEVRKALAKFQSLNGNDSAFDYAAIYAQWGDTQNSLRWLETAYRLHDDGLIDMKTYWLLDPIRDTGGYKDIERRMNFPP
ncbi:MAG TPA: winged helix-turn-helix domain-containing protein [Rhizomicrobium sp.]|jgi:TolB-like protein/DNA-binding winged helix-turn-helix (wHTH) protein|nr:winged helix-turn-helix domain-containing protein [Rhizomicrobium sp.]